MEVIYLLKFWIGIKVRDIFKDTDSSRYSRV